MLAMLLLAGCASDQHDHEEWTFDERTTADDVTTLLLDVPEGFTQTLDLRASQNVRQLNGQWHGALPKGKPFTLRFNASADMAVEFRLTTSDATAASGRCDWGEHETAKDVALGTAQMHNTSRSCEIVFTPITDIVNSEGPALRWGARTTQAQADGWSMRFESTL